MSFLSSRWLPRGLLLSLLAMTAAGAYWNYSDPPSPQRPAAAASPDAPPLENTPEETYFTLHFQPPQLPLEQPPATEPKATPKQPPAEESSSDREQKPPLKNPLTRALDAYIRDHQEEFDEAEADTDDLFRQLREADQVLWKAKQDNREAIRQANRQVPRRHSPDLLVIVAEGLQKSDLGNNTPNINGLALSGLQMERFSSSPRSLEAARWAFLTGREPAEGEANPSLLKADYPTLPGVLWQGGYRTMLVGETWWWAPQKRRDFDDWLGNRTAEESQQGSLEQIWRNGKKVGLRNPRPLTESQSEIWKPLELWTQLAKQLLDQRFRGRPKALFLSLKKPAGPSGAEALDRQIGALMEHLRIRRRESRTAVFVIGMNGGEKASPLLVRRTNHLQAGREIFQRVDEVDLLPTIAEFAGAWRLPKGLAGDSRATEWRQKTPAIGPPEEPIEPGRPMEF